MQTPVQAGVVDAVDEAETEVPPARSHSEGEPGVSSSAVPPAFKRQNKIYGVISYKGGVGKSTLAYEIAHGIGAVAVDFDFDKGGISGMWGYKSEERLRNPLLDAFEKGIIPHPLSGGRFRPDLVPSHKDLVLNQPPPHQVAEALEQWKVAWGRDIVVDTHPGGGVDLTDAVKEVANLLLVIIQLKANEMRATEDLLADLAGYPIMLVPNEVPNKKVPPPMLNWLSRLTEHYEVPVAPPVSIHGWISDSPTRRMAASAVRGKKGDLIRREIEDVTEAVINYGVKRA